MIVKSSNGSTFVADDKFGTVRFGETIPVGFAGGRNLETLRHLSRLQLGSEDLNLAAKDAKLQPRIDCIISAALTTACDTVPILPRTPSSRLGLAG